MKKLVIGSMLIFILLNTSSCGVNNAIIANLNHNTTDVQLSRNNFNVIDKVSGTAEVKYIFFIGGMRKTQLYENAYSNMINKADLSNGSRALVNITTEEHVGGVPPFYLMRTITVSAHVIEFTD